MIPQSGMFCQFSLDESGDHGPVDTLRDRRRGAKLTRKRNCFRNDLLNTLRSLDVSRCFLEPSRLFYIPFAFGQQRNNLKVKAINAPTQLLDGLANFDSVHNNAPCLKNEENKK